MALTADQSARLAALQAAYDALISGAAVAKVSSGGRSVDYAQGDQDRLRREIDALEAQATGRGRRRGAITFRFGRR